jgi:hypothetical protein
MKEVTLSIDDDVLAASEAYAKAHNLPLASLINQMLFEAVQQDGRSRLARSFRIADEAKAAAGMTPWSRDDLHER